MSGESMPRPEAARPDGELAARLRVVAVRLFRCLRTRAFQQLTPSQVTVLARITAAGPLRLGALAEAEALSPATLTRMIEVLAGLGLVERLPDPDDRRAVLVATSPRGLDLVERMRESGNAVLRAALDGLTEQQRTTLAAAVPVLEELVNRLQEREPDRRAPDRREPAGADPATGPPVGVGTASLV